MTTNEVLRWVQDNVAEIQQTSMFGPDMVLVLKNDGNFVAGHDLWEIVDMEVNDKGGKLVIDNNDALKDYFDVKQGDTQYEE